METVDTVATAGTADAADAVPESFVAPSGVAGSGAAADAAGEDWGPAAEIDPLVVRVLAHGSDPAPLPADVQAAVAAVLEGLGPGPDAVRLLSVLDPAVLSGACVLAVIRAAERQVSWMQALVVGHTARFAQPGVAVPVRHLIDALTNGDGGLTIVGGNPLAEVYDDQRADHHDTEGAPCDGRPEDADCLREDQVSRLFADPIWGPALAGEAQRLAGPEIAVALTLSPITAGKRIAEAVEFTTDLVPTLLAWQGGAIDRCRAWTIADATAGLPKDLRGRIQQAVLHRAADLTPGRLRALIGRVAIELDPAVRDRHEEAKSRRQVTLNALRDGLARLSADLPADQALLGFKLIDDLAGALPDGPEDHRGIAERRADVLADLLCSLAVHGHVDLRGAADSRSDVDDDPPVAAEGFADSCGSGADPDGRADSGGADSDPVAAPDGGADPVVDPDGGADPVVDPDGGTDPVVDPDGGADSRGAVRRPGMSRAGGCRRRGPVHVDVIMAASTLAGLDEQAAHLVGFGAIPADIARSLVRSASSIRSVLQHARPQCDPAGPEGTAGSASPPGTGPACARGSSPGGHTVTAGECGTTLDYGRTVYRPPAALDRYVRDRDQTCRFPGCRQPAWRCDIDHREPYGAGGVTCACNLDALCRSHHRVKTFTEWKADRQPDGSLRWRSPLGQCAISGPDHRPTDTTTVGPAEADDDPAPF